MTTFVTLSPTSYTHAFTTPFDVDAVDAPTGIGDVTDEVDTTYYTLAAYTDFITGEIHAEILECVYQMPASQNPFAFVLQYRMRTPHDTFLNPAAFPNLPSVAFGLMDSDRNPLLQAIQDTGPVDPLVQQTQELPDEFIWFFDHAVDLDNPSDAGFWNHNVDGITAAFDALTGDGLIIQLFPYQPHAEGGPTKPYLDVIEARLLVACNPGGKPILRVHPRRDGRGTSTTPNLIGTRSRQSTNRVAGNTYL